MKIIKPTVLLPGPRQVTGFPVQLQNLTKRQNQQNPLKRRKQKLRNPVNQQPLKTVRPKLVRWQPGLPHIGQQNPVPPGQAAYAEIDDDFGDFSDISFDDGAADALDSSSDSGLDDFDTGISDSFDEDELDLKSFE